MFPTTRRSFLAASAAAGAAACAEPLTVRAKRKPADPWTEYPTRTIETLEGFRAPAKSPAVSQYGGLLSRKNKATGFFRAAEADGRWWMFDPEGHPYLNVGVVSVTPGRSRRNQAALKEQFGSEAKWADAATSLIRRHGFNGLGNWSATDALREAAHPLPYTVTANFMGTFGRKLGVTHQQPGHLGYANDAFPVFHPGFTDFCDEYARTVTARRDDKLLLGYFSDNELPAPQDMIDKALALDPANERLAPMRRAAQEWLANRKGASSTIADLTADDRDAYRGYVYDRYLQLTSVALRKYDPNHMLLGPRLHGASFRSPAIWAAAGKFLDAIAVNIYWQWSPEAALLEMWRKQGGKPFIVTEFYAKGDDSGFPNTSGAGWIVPTQLDRAYFYQNFTLGLLESRLSVGWHWFKYMDNDPEDLTTDPSNRDSNKGIVTLDFKPYTALLNAMEPLNRSVYALAEYFDRKRT